jgi:antitoxin CptB
MLNAENIKDAEQRRLAWRCRRGMLELDLVLQRFVATHFYALTLDELHAFDTLLAMPDNDLWNTLQFKNLHLKDGAQQSVMDKLHALRAA